MNHQIVSRPWRSPPGITENGVREVLGLMVGDSETEVLERVPALAARAGPDRGPSGHRRSPRPHPARHRRRHARTTVSQVQGDAPGSKDRTGRLRGLP
ncbi:hypothetical protein ACH4LQ_10990 [Streptomyces globisporus]|uniref:hypothetical protein n=1 Tax=Streptomyces globisporus TaxID=1908 RepID=UPI00378D8B33